VEAEEPTAFSAPPLRLLKELKWYAERSSQPALALRRFLGVRPVVLRASCARIVDRLPTCGSGALAIPRIAPARST
jgi:hypothetical protein